MGNPMLYIDPLGLDTAGITWHIRIPEVVAGGDNSMAYVSAMEAGRAAGDRARREANFNNGMQEAYSGRGSSRVTKAELEERRRAEQAAARYRAYVANRSNYGRNAYSPSLGPQTVDEWEKFGDFLGSFEILFVSQLGDLISLGANIIKGSRSGILMSAAGFIPFGSQFKLAAKTGFGSMMEAGEAARYAKYWESYAPKQITSGTTRMDWLRVSGRTGRIESSRVIYDNYGRQIYRVDFSNHMRPLNYSVPHLHQYQYGPMSSFGKESVFNFLGK